MTNTETTPCPSPSSAALPAARTSRLPRNASKPRARAPRFAKQSQTRIMPLASFPPQNEAKAEPAAEREFAILQEIVVSARALRASNTLDPKARLDATLYTRQNGVYVEAIQKLA